MGLEAVDRLAACLAKLPGVGRRTAARMALALARDPDGLARSLEAALAAARSGIRECSRCGNLTPAGEDPCRLCTSPAREGHLLCVVEDPADIASIEQTGGYRGRYHALMGKLSPARGEGPHELRVEKLLGRVRDEGIREVILALSTDVEGDATAAYLAERLRAEGVRVTRPAFGLPAGSGIRYADPLTLERAFEGRREA